jgi:multisubunit Na+/H+ antiporter MnhB subunit
VTPRQRLVLFAVAVTGLVGCYLWAFSGLPGFGNYPGPCGQAILAHAIAQTNATGVVSAINFEYRGFDTVGEEFILFTAAAGMSVVLRRLRPEAVVDAAEAVGAGGFAAVGVAAVALGFPYLYNFLPLGKIPGSVSSSGTIALISLLVGIEVAAAFVAIIAELLEQSLIVRRPTPAPPSQPQPASPPQPGGTD